MDMDMDMDIDRHSPVPSLNSSQPPDPPHLSLPTTFNIEKFLTFFDMVQPSWMERCRYFGLELTTISFLLMNVLKPCSTGVFIVNFTCC